MKKQKSDKKPVDFEAFEAKISPACPTAVRYRKKYPRSH